MKKAYAAETVETPKGTGVVYRETGTGKELGIFTGSVGLYGTSTGIFTHMKTTHISEVVEVAAL